jgi:hypothetical protein
VNEGVGYSLEHERYARAPGLAVLLQICSLRTGF